MKDISNLSTDGDEIIVPLGGEEGEVGTAMMGFSITVMLTKLDGSGFSVSVELIDGNPAGLAETVKTVLSDWAVILRFQEGTSL